MSTVIKIENVSKQYHLGLIGTNTLKGDIQRWWYNMRGLPDPTLMVGHENNLSSSSLTPQASHPEDFIWALKDINFEVKHGEVLGIIGKNGAGKSTLLKLLSRVTAPTTGNIKVKGRIASLLEVGTGFHPELSGRENIFLNGAILGMVKSEIQSKFDEIVDFAGVEKYIDTPVKRYSSGMYVRLAFAVAAHLEPEILVVDEVLAVGDAEFQKKAIGKMQDVSHNQGRTVLFVSHNMGSVRKLCNKGILLENGFKTYEGEINSVIDKYLVRGSSFQKAFKPFLIEELGIAVTKIAVNENNEGKVFPFLPLLVTIELESKQDLNNIGIQIMLSHDHTEGFVFASNTKQTKGLDNFIRKGKNHLECLIDSFKLCSGEYHLGFAIDIPFVKFLFLDMDLMCFEVFEVMSEHSSLSTSASYGHVYLDHKWILL
jgi:lipopolysaccharide transport system ATP-binding protein